MGTNYYHERTPLTDAVCPRCHRACEQCEGENRIHIGKSSAGWTFLFHATDTIRSYADWLVALEAGGIIRDEYGDVIPLADFRAKVEAKRAAPNDHARQYPRDNTYHDADGHSFTAGYFS